MFYAHFILNKKGPLSRIWLAAHWDRKLTKAQIFETNIEGSVTAIISPQVKLALRTSGHLLLGVVRIYSRKAKYLLADCNEALSRIKLAFRPGLVDLPVKNREASVSAITLKENFYDFDLAMIEINEVDIQSGFNVNQSRKEDITLREDQMLPVSNMRIDDGFGDFGFGNAIDCMTDIMFFMGKKTNMLPELGETIKQIAEVQPDVQGQEVPTVSEFVQLFEETHIAPAVQAKQSVAICEIHAEVQPDVQGQEVPTVSEFVQLFEETHVAPAVRAKQSVAICEIHAAINENVEERLVHRQEEQPIVEDRHQIVAAEQTTLIENNKEAFVLEPVDLTSVEKKLKRKRKLIVDDTKMISSATLKEQLQDSSEIVVSLDLAPPSKKLMNWKDTGNVDMLLVLPGRPLIVTCLMNQAYTQNLITRCIPEASATIDWDQNDMTTEVLRSHDDYEDENLAVNLTSRDVNLSSKSKEPQNSAVNGSVELFSQDEAPLDPVDNRRRSSRLAVVGSQSAELLHNNSMELEESQLEGGRPRESGKSLLVEPVPPEVERLSLLRQDLPSTLGSGREDDLFNYDPMSSNDNGIPQTQEDVEREKQRRIKRSTQMMTILESELNNGKTIKFKELLKNNNRKQVAAKFHTLLMLKKEQLISVQQKKPYGDILIRSRK